MVGEVFAGLSAIKSALDIAKTLKDIDDATKRNTAVIELQQQILSAQQAQFELIDKVSGLEKEVSRLKAWDAEKEKYELKSVGRGASAYVRKQNAEPAEDPHCLCANCYARNQKSFLQYSDSKQRDHIYKCAACSAEIRVDYSISPSGR